uniref:uncharacterized protein LOC122597149 n=1 Tax=Erigeron canadensis TaxID=72917 RepID=UPI001CB98784|nr:uncharacterized protein LOC122597149 [Erigeron canadensis]
MSTSTSVVEEFERRSKELGEKQDKLFKDLGDCLVLSDQIRQEHKGLTLEAIGRWGKDMTTLKEELIQCYKELAEVHGPLEKAKGNVLILETMVSKFKRLHPEINQRNGK